MYANVVYERYTKLNLYIDLYLQRKFEKKVSTFVMIDSYFIDNMKDSFSEVAAPALFIFR